MNDSTHKEGEGDAELKGKPFDEVCELIKDDDRVTGSVYKKPDGGAGRWSFCFGFGPTEYTEQELLATIVAEYGPGEYPVQFKSPNKTNRPEIRWHKHMHVQARRLGALQTATPPAPAAVAATGFEAFAVSIETQMRALAAALEKVAKQEPSEQKTTIDFVKELGAIKDLFSDNRQSALEQFKDAMELRKLIKDDDDNGGGDPLSLAIKSLTPAIERGVSALAEKEADQVRRPGAPAPEAIPDEPAPVAEPPLEQDPEVRINYAYQLFAERFLPGVLQLAETGQEPEQVAEYLVRLIGTDEQTIEMVGLVIMQDDMVLRLAKANARVLQFTAWLDAVADWVAHALWPATNPPPEPFSATNDATLDESDQGGGINDAESTGAEPAEPTASGEPLPDAKPSSDAPRTGDDNDA